MAAATALAIGGIGLGIASFFGGSSSAKKQAALEKQKFAEQQKIEEQKRLGMELDANRRILATTRAAQQARSIALTNATASGAGRGSALAGGLGQIYGEAGGSLEAISQNLSIGRSIGQANENISGLNMQLADVKADESFWSGLGNLGGSFTKAAGMPMFQ